MGLPISLEERPQILATLARVIEQGEPGHYISITNTESMYHGLRDSEHGRYIRGADLSLCDGVGRDRRRLGVGPAHPSATTGRAAARCLAVRPGAQPGGTSSTAARKAWPRRWRAG
jgi:UDP-N-acetyl-D-mannosaminuronic acid transferase (WecB/TagA/CpsF family)